MKDGSKVEGKIEVYKAMQFESLSGIVTNGFYTSDLYMIVGKPGIWRRVRRMAKSGLGKREGAELAIFGATMIELVRDKVAERELAAAAFKLAGVDFQTQAIAENKAKPLSTSDTRPGQPSLPDTEEGAFDAAGMNAANAGASSLNGRGESVRGGANGSGGGTSQEEYEVPARKMKTSSDGDCDSASPSPSSDQGEDSGDGDGGEAEAMAAGVGEKAATTARAAREAAAV